MTSKVNNNNNTIMAAPVVGWNPPQMNDYKNQQHQMYHQQQNHHQQMQLHHQMYHQQQHHQQMQLQHQQQHQQQMYQQQQMQIQQQHHYQMQIHQNQQQMQQQYNHEQKMKEYQLKMQTEVGVMGVDCSTAALRVDCSTAALRMDCSTASLRGEEKVSKSGQDEVMQIIEKLKDKKFKNELNLKTELCDTYKKNKKCYRKYCTYAHSIYELQIKKCGFDNLCIHVKNVDNVYVNIGAHTCYKIHGTETTDDYYLRIKQENPNKINKVIIYLTDEEDDYETDEDDSESQLGCDSESPLCSEEYKIFVNDSLIKFKDEYLKIKQLDIQNRQETQSEPEDESEQATCATECSISE